jgi:hypothetical protein
MIAGMLADVLKWLRIAEHDVGLALILSGLVLFAVLLVMV